MGRVDREIELIVVELVIGDLVEDDDQLGMRGSTK